MQEQFKEIFFQQKLNEEVPPLNSIEEVQNVVDEDHSLGEHLKLIQTD